MPSFHFPFFRSAIIIAVRLNPVRVLTRKTSPDQEAAPFLARLAPGQTLVASPILHFGQSCPRCITGGVIRNMKNFLRIALAVLFLLSIATAQNIPAIDVFGGYSFLGFNMPSSVDTTAQRLSL